MKLDDIKKSIYNALESELQRAIYNAAGVISRYALIEIFEKTIEDIYELQPPSEGVGTSKAD